MNGTAARFVRLGAGFLGLVTLAWILTGQAKSRLDELPYHDGVPTDWSHSHVVFSAPGSDEQARALAQDPRYWQQLYRRALVRHLGQNPASEISGEVTQAMHRAGSGGLWSEDLGANTASGGGNYPAKYGFSLTIANCGNATTPDYVAYSTGLQGSGTQASIVAYDNIYSGCTGTVPSTYWAYNTGGLILTSPVISLDGTQIAFVQTSGSPTGQAGLVVLKWKASTTETVGAPGVPTSVTAANYPTCVAPCMTEVLLHDGKGFAVDDRTSSPFYDYTGDIAWVGDSTSDWLHKVTGVFKGTPTEVKGGGFPAQLNSGNAPLSNPVYDHKSTNIFIGDALGFEYRVSSTTGAVTKSAQLDFGTGLVQGPVLDQTNGFLYVFASSDGSASCTGGTACAAVYVLGTSFGSGTTGSKITVGQSVVKGTLPNPNPLYTGGFDSAYYNSVGGTGNMYVCGNTGAAPTLYRVPITAGVMGASEAISGLTPAGRSPACSPVTDFPNPNASSSDAELIFFSAQNFALPCARKGCLMNLVSLPWQPNTSYTQGQEVLILNPTNSRLYINTAASTGKSGATAPTWPVTVGKKTTDNTVTWVNQGFPAVIALPTWTANHTYGGQAQIFDGTNVEVAIVAGKSGATAPAWNPTVGQTTTDNLVTWINAGAFASANRTITGGTGGVIIDNASSSAGASQAYFFTLGNQLCSTSGGTGSCAMQVSQANLK